MDGSVGALKSSVVVTTGLAPARAAFAIVAAGFGVAIISVVGVTGVEVVGVGAVVVGVGAATGTVEMAGDGATGAGVGLSPGVGVRVEFWSIFFLLVLRNNYHYYNLYAIF
jgi:hypothetical protein